MIHLREIQSATLNDLPDISEVQPLTDSDQPMVTEIYNVLRKYNAEKRFGLTLLHKHFDIDDDTEVLMESTDSDTRTQTIQPIKKQELKTLNYTETAWRLDSGKALMACNCINMGNAGHQHHPRG